MPDYVDISFPPQLVNDTDLVEMSLRFYADYLLAPDNWDSVEKGLHVVKYGEREHRCELEDGLLVSGIYKFTIGDELGDLIALLLNDTCDREGIVTVTLNEQPFFTGKVRDDSIIIDYGKRTVELEARANSDLLARYQVKGVDDSILNPFGYALDGTMYEVETLIADMLQVVNPSVTITRVHDWLYWAYDTGREETYDNVPFEEITLGAYIIYGSTTGPVEFTYGVNLAEILKNIARHFFCMIGYLDNDRAIMRKLFTFDETTVQTMGRKLRHVAAIKWHQIKYVIGKYQGNVLWEIPDTDAYTVISGEFIEVNAPWEFYGARRASDDVMFNLLHAKDPVINDPGAHYDLLEQACRCWWYYRGDKKFGRADSFLYEGVGYAFERDFVEGGLRYQPIMMKVNLDNNTTEIEALYLGADA